MEEYGCDTPEEIPWDREREYEARYYYGDRYDTLSDIWFSEFHYQGESAIFEFSNGVRLSSLCEVCHHYFLGETDDISWKHYHGDLSLTIRCQECDWSSDVTMPSKSCLYWVNNPYCPKCYMKNNHDIYKSECMECGGYMFHGHKYYVESGAKCGNCYIEYLRGKVYPMSRKN